MDPDQPDPFEPPLEQAKPAKPAPIAADASERLSPPPAPRLRLPWTVTLGFVVGLVGVVALGAAAWVYAETQREIMRLSTELAQVRLSLELFNQRADVAPPETGADPDLTDLANRLAILEENWREAPAATPAPAPAAAAAPTGDAAAGDCLPVGTRFLVTTGDRYPVCGQPAAVEVGAVDDGFITLADSTVIAAGGTFPLAGTSCMLGLVNAGPELGGYAEIRVTC